MSSLKKLASVISYRDFNSYCPNVFRAELNSILSFDLSFIDNDTFTQIVMDLLNKYCPIKLKYLRGNDSPFMTKDLRKAIMHRSKLRNKMNRLKTVEAFDEYRKQRNYCTSLLRKAKRSYFMKLNPSDIADNKKFWKSVKPLFSEKLARTSGKIKLLENGVIHDEDSSVAQEFGKYFSSIVDNLNIPIDIITENTGLNSNSDPISNAISKYANHPSILKIRQHVGRNSSFSFSHVSLHTVRQEISHLMRTKATPISSIPPSIIKEHCDIFRKRYKLILMHLSLMVFFLII